VRELLADGERGGLATGAICSIVFECAEWAAIGAATVREAQRESPPGRLFGLLG